MISIDKALDFMTVFNMSTSMTVEEAKTDYPKLFSIKREAAKTWFENNKNK